MAAVKKRVTGGTEAMSCKGEDKMAMLITRSSESSESFKIRDLEATPWRPEGKLVRFAVELGGWCSEKPSRSQNPTEVSVPTLALFDLRSAVTYVETQ